MARNALGRGLSALIREAGPVDAPTNAAAAGTAPALAPGSEAVVQIDFDLIDPSPFQPRMQFDEFKMEELTAINQDERNHPADSGAAHGSAFSIDCGRAAMAGGAAGADPKSAGDRARYSR